MNKITGGVCAAKGFTANGVHCGIRKNRSKRDLALIYSEVRASAAAVYTTNLVKGAPLTVTKKIFRTALHMPFSATAVTRIPAMQTESGLPPGCASFSGMN